MIDDSRNHEQQIGQAVDVRQQVRFDAISAETHDRAFGAAAHGAREMQKRTRTIAARQNESAQRRQLGFESIDPIFEPLYVGICDGGFRDTLRDLFSGIGEPRANRKQVLLQTLEHSSDVPRQFALCADGPEACVQLVDVAVCRHARIGFRHARAAEERRAAGIARARINLHGRQYT